MDGNGGRGSGGTGQGGGQGSGQGNDQEDSAAYFSNLAAKLLADGGGDGNNNNNSSNHNNSNSNLSNDGSAGGGGGGGGGGNISSFPPPTLRASYNSSPAILTSGLRRTMSGSKRPLPNEEFGGGMGGMAGGSRASSRNVRGSSSRMGRSSTFTSAQSGWQFGTNVPNANAGGNAAWTFTGCDGGGGEEVRYQQSVSGGLSGLAGGGMGMGMGGGMDGSSQFRLQHSSSDIADLINRRTGGNLNGMMGGNSGSSGGMGGAGLVFDPSSGGLRQATGGALPPQQPQHGNVRIPRPTGADFLSMMGLNRPTSAPVDGSGSVSGGGGGGGGNTASSVGASSSGMGLHRSSGGGRSSSSSSASAVIATATGTVQPLKRGGGSAMLRRSSHNLSGMQLSKLPEEGEHQMDVDGGTCGGANYGFGTGPGHSQQQPQPRNPMAAQTAKEIMERMQQLRREKAGGAAAASEGGGSGENGRRQQPQPQSQQDDKNHEGGGGAAAAAAGPPSISGSRNATATSDLSRISSGVSSIDVQGLINEEFGSLGGGSDSQSQSTAQARVGGDGDGGADNKSRTGTGVDASSGELSVGPLGDFDFDQHAQDLAAEISEQVAMEMLGAADDHGAGIGTEIGIGSGIDGTGTDGTAGESISGTGTGTDTDTAQQQLQPPPQQQGQQGGMEEFTDYDALDFEPTPISAASERILYERRASVLSTVSDTSLLANSQGMSGQQQQQQHQQQPFANNPNIVSSPQLPSTTSNVPLQGGVSTTAAQGNLPGEDGGNISVQSQLQHVTHGGATHPQSDVPGLPDLGINFSLASLDGPRDDNWKTNAILQLSKVGPLTSDPDGLLPVHLACLYCPNDKKLVGSILIDNPESAMFVVRRPSDKSNCDQTNSSQIDAIIALTSNALAASRKKANPSVIISKLQGSYPLHVALRGSGGEKITYEVVKLLTLSGPSILTTQDALGCVPLSIALQNKVGSQIIRYLLERDKGAASMADIEGNYPLHYACTVAKGKKRYSLAIIKLIAQSYMGALKKANIEGKTPIDIARGPDEGEKTKDGDAVLDYLENALAKITAAKMN